MREDLLLEPLQKLRMLLEVLPGIVPPLTNALRIE